MDSNLLIQIAISIFNSGETKAGYLDSPHTVQCRKVFAILTNQVNPQESFATTCKNLLLSMAQKPTDEDVSLLISYLQEYVSVRQAQ